MSRTSGPFGNGVGVSDPNLRQYGERARVFRLKGDRGVLGDVGERGDTGDNGDIGLKGEVGEQGDLGNRGFPGDKGDGGFSGGLGEKGQVGSSGDEGLKGGLGSKGIAEQGEKGLKGESGSLGGNGRDGIKGEKGDANTIPGEKGDQGTKGSQGSFGDAGASTDQGVKGAKGDFGDLGEDASIGGMGDKGFVGAKGEEGLFTGVQGPLGDKGDKGVPGDKGFLGPMGAKGDTGDLGTKGESGMNAICCESYPENNTDMDISVIGSSQVTFLKSCLVIGCISSCFVGTDQIVTICGSFQLPSASSSISNTDFIAIQARLNLNTLNGICGIDLSSAEQAIERVPLSVSLPLLHFSINSRQIIDSSTNSTSSYVLIGCHSGYGDTLPISVLSDAVLISYEPSVVLTKEVSWDFKLCFKVIPMNTITIPTPTLETSIESLLASQNIDTTTPTFSLRAYIICAQGAGGGGGGSNFKYALSLDQLIYSAGGGGSSGSRLVFTMSYNTPNTLSLTDTVVFAPGTIGMAGSRGRYDVTVTPSFVQSTAGTNAADSVVTVTTSTGSVVATVPGGRGGGTQNNITQPNGQVPTDAPGGVAPPLPFIITNGAASYDNSTFAAGLPGGIGPKLIFPWGNPVNPAIAAMHEAGGAGGAGYDCNTLSLATAPVGSKLNVTPPIITHGSGGPGGSSPHQVNVFDAAYSLLDGYPGYNGAPAESTMTIVYTP